MACCKDKPLLSTQAWDNFLDVIFLKQADGGDACGSGLEAEEGVVESDASQGQNWNLVPACLAEGLEARGIADKGSFFFEDRSENSEVGMVLLSGPDFFRRVARDGGKRAGLAISGVEGTPV